MNPQQFGALALDILSSATIPGNPQARRQVDEWERMAVALAQGALTFAPVTPEPEQAGK